MSEPLSLPLLQMQLDHLVPGQGLHLVMADVERLFGYNDVATGRIRNFADGHGCMFAWCATGVQFVKLASPDR
ncbi:hypothetical protein [Bradyrhizobium sp. SRS-191]|uniref:hypothetical protein n=1 Tax=Bradyrhizobium sp. SRS-191 TaxID=2962606 RepID=UPI00211E7D55|nr:hypothetical protein [Bradyrhizobium sp. SRS-191]